MRFGGDLKTIYKGTLSMQIIPFMKRPYFGTIPDSLAIIPKLFEKHKIKEFCDDRT